ncbi:class I SAM-dependent methyltransferase [Microvirga pudoricolor]|uniref:class I SAM-dependent methyltransferase n=1 Tax=Microvirga pudoricolor TaxID=2778729 RepID=UPI00195001BA|nr:class I SAM-dependent methyltransferase [Microvirga pudoricolor]MBM6594715.1 class I SAM-dependent methyltransferase [Microvirga pudoricolor]
MANTSSPSDAFSRPGLYGAAPPELVRVPDDAVQFSPLVPGAARLEDQAEGTLSGFSLLAPPGTVERRYTLALALRALRPGAPFTALAPKDKGGSRLGKELASFGCGASETAKRHHRICAGERPAGLSGLDEAIADGAPRFVDALGLWSQPGVFSWDRADPGSELLVRHLPPLRGRGADLGCGIGFLSRAVLASPGVERISLIDIDRRAVDLARRNIADARAEARWSDVRESGTGLAGLDFVVMNPPFHDGGAEDRSLGQSFIRRAAEALRPGGTLWLTANRHLPYEGVLQPLFRSVALKAEASGYKIYEARR